jgi:hypothetical protein
VLNNDCEKLVHLKKIWGRNSLTEVIVSGRMRLIVLVFLRDWAYLGLSYFGCN